MCIVRTNTQTLFQRKGVEISELQEKRRNSTFNFPRNVWVEWLDLIGDVSGYDMMWRERWDKIRNDMICDHMTILWYYMICQGYENFADFRHLSLGMTWQDRHFCFSWDLCENKSSSDKMIWHEMNPVAHKFACWFLKKNHFAERKKRLASGDFQNTMAFQTLAAQGWIFFQLVLGRTQDMLLQQQSTVDITVLYTTFSVVKVDGAIPERWIGKGPW